MAEICVKAVIAVADLERKDVNLELIKVTAIMFMKLLDGSTTLLSAQPCTCIVRPCKPVLHCVAACMILHTHLISVRCVRLMQCVNGL